MMSHRFFLGSLVLVGVFCLVFSGFIGQGNAYIVSDGEYSGEAAYATCENTIVGFLYTNNYPMDLYVNNVSFFYFVNSGKFMTCKAIIYAYKGGVLVANSSNETHYGRTWQIFQLDTTAVLETGEAYWICLWTNLSADLYSFVPYETSGTTKYHYDAETFDGICPDPWANTTADDTTTGNFLVHWDINITENLMESYTNCTGTLEFTHNQTGYWAWSNVSGNWSHYVATVVTEGDLMFENGAIFFVLWVILACAMLFGKNVYQWFIGGIGLLLISFYAGPLIDPGVYAIFMITTVFVVLIAWAKAINRILSKEERG